MDLKNGYKVIYENRVIEEGELERHLRATKTVPATADTNLIYKDNTGAVITAAELKAFKLVYEKDGSLFGSTDGKVKATDRKILVYSGADLLIGEVDTVAQAVLTPKKAAKKATVVAKEVPAEVVEEPVEEEK